MNDPVVKTLSPDDHERFLLLLRGRQDSENHDGVSQPEELHKLEDFGVYAISLKYQETQRKDHFGNLFWFTGELNPEGSAPHMDGVDSVVYDVLLPVDPSQKCKNE